MDGSLRAPFWLGADTNGRVDGIAVGDIDGDGDAEAAVAAYPGVDLYSSQGGRLLAEPWLVPGTWGASRVRIVDFDGDHRNVVLFVRRSASPGGVLLARNRGGSFRISRLIRDSTFTDYADVTGDGRGDIVTMFNSTGTLSVYPRRARGGFDKPMTYTLTHPFPLAAGVGDVTGDGRNDVVLAGDSGWPNSYLMVMAQNRSGKLDPPVLIPTDRSPEAVYVRDMNRDGRQDVVVFHDYEVGVYLQAPGGQLLPESLYRTGTGATGGDIGNRPE